jgi:hypothetical protein
VTGSTTCSRLGCDQPAVALFSFDARACLAWLDPVGSGGGAGMLCQVHADRMSPPKGWNLLDRRAPESRLWLGRPALESDAAERDVAEAVPTRSHRTARGRRTRPHEPTGPRLPFDAPPDGSRDAPFDTPEVREPVSSARVVDAHPAPAPDAPPTGSPWSPRDRPGPELHRILDARTPLLARAFDAARSGDETL